MLYQYLHSINKSIHFFLKRGKSSQNIILEDIRGGSSISFLEHSAALSSPGACAAFPNHGSCTTMIRHFRKILKEPRILTALLRNPSRRAQSVAVSRKTTLPLTTAPEVVKQTIYLLKFLKDESPRPFPLQSHTWTTSWCWLLSRRNRNFPSSRSTLQHRDFMPTDESNSDCWQSHRWPYFKCKYSGLYKWVLWPLFTGLPTVIYTEISFLCVSEKPGLKKLFTNSSRLH